MKLKNQVTSLELAKKLKKLGVKQHSSMFWIETDDNPKTANLANKKNAGKVMSWHRQLYSAFNVAELGEMLPWCINEDKEDEMFLSLSKESNGMWRAHYETSESKWESIIEEKEANCRAKMLIYLLENNLYENTN